MLTDQARVIDMSERGPPFLAFGVSLGESDSADAPCSVLSAHPDGFPPERCLTSLNGPPSMLFRELLRQQLFTLQGCLENILRSFLSSSIHELPPTVCFSWRLKLQHSPASSTVLSRGCCFSAYLFPIWLPSSPPTSVNFSFLGGRQLLLFLGPCLTLALLS